mmetsp:Transcript_99642/g.179845  ORF Transcript_99642/g.179845 Transcript_99642/m.179845 type:complete len:325 (+) Transcript_99642:77-1051(+)
MEGDLPENHVLFDTDSDSFGEAKHAASSSASVAQIPQIIPQIQQQVPVALPVGRIYPASQENSSCDTQSSGASTKSTSTSSRQKHRQESSSSSRQKQETLAAGITQLKMQRNGDAEKTDVAHAALRVYLNTHIKKLQAGSQVDPSAIPYSEEAERAEFLTRLKKKEQKQAQVMLQTISLGSKLHGTGKCRPCTFVDAVDGCEKDDQCPFCHVPHAMTSRGRPSKGTREACKRIVELFEEHFPPDHPHRDLVAQKLENESPFLMSLFARRMGTKKKKTSPDSSTGTTGLESINVSQSSADSWSQSGSLALCFDGSDVQLPPELER